MSRRNQPAGPQYTQTRVRAVSLGAALALTAVTLTACGSSAEPKAAAARSTPKPKPAASVDCSDTSLSQADWVKSCQEPPPAKKGDVDTSQDRALGAAAETLGSSSPAEGTGGGVLEITPSSVVYVAKGTGQKPAGDLFAVVAYRTKSTKAVAAAESAPIENGGWKWIARDGQAIDTLSGNASSVVPDGYAGGGTVQPGTFEWRSQAFDLTKTQRGGTLIYIDGDGAAYRWTMPARDAGPDAAKLRKALLW